jgi:hypothetical protein
MNKDWKKIVDITANNKSEVNLFKTDIEDLLRHYRKANGLSDLEKEP